MVGEIAAMARGIAELGDATISAPVLAAMERVPRHLFVPAPGGHAAYDNRPVGIGHGQTISQPFIVALMTDLLALERGHRVLEIGTGSGYQTAILAELAGEVYSVENVEALAGQTHSLLRELGYANVRTMVGDGARGWPEHAPFDRIVVTAAARRVPQALIDQLAEGGRMVIPVGSPDGIQDLMLIVKSVGGALDERNILPVRFVPLIEGAG
jgi:protein-L-isoaspartate(D-aspartate) O-methyltransferase